METQPKVPASEADTCRICRCEGTPEDPLYYPCKCNGSIKFVHQNCLMEWLSHSQKKYCELCKTHFRFTKLYQSDMPRSLPPLVFIKHAIIYLARKSVVWLRAVLVASVWLCWLPYLMRRLWSFLFWISDDGIDGLLSASHARETVNERDIAVLQSYAICPSSPLTALTSCPPISQFSPAVYERVVASSQYGGYSSMRSYTLSERLFFGLLRFLFPGPANKAEMSALNSSNFASPYDNSSVLGNVSLLRNLTKYPHVNKAIITILEGQLITLLVIASFILIILVRDYVVQHQPEVPEREEEEEEILQARNARDLLGHELENEFVARRNAALQNIFDDSADSSDNESGIAFSEDSLGDDNDAVQTELARHRLLLEQYKEWYISGELQTRDPAFVDDSYFNLVVACVQATMVSHDLHMAAKLLKSIAKLDYQMDSQDDLDNYIRLLIKHKGDHDYMLRETFFSSIHIDPRLSLALQKYLTDGDPLFPEPILPETAEELEARRIAEARYAETFDSEAVDTDFGYTSTSFGTPTDPVVSHEVPMKQYDGPRSESSKTTGKGKEKAPKDVTDRVADEAFIRMLEINAIIRDGSANSSSSRPRSQSDGPAMRDGIAPLGNGSWAYGPSDSSMNKDDPLEQSSTSGITASAGWSFSALESQPFFARTRDDETPFGDSSPPHHNNGHSRVQSENGSNISQLVSTIGLDDGDNSDWESISDDQGNEGSSRSIEQNGNNYNHGLTPAPALEASSSNEFVGNGSPNNHLAHVEMDVANDPGDSWGRSPWDPPQRREEIRHHPVFPHVDHRRPLIVEPAEHLEHVENVAGLESEDDEHTPELSDADSSDEDDHVVPPHDDGALGEPNPELPRNDAQDQQRVANLLGILAEFMWGDLENEPIIEIDDNELPDPDNEDGWFDAVPDVMGPVANDAAGPDGEVFDNDEFDGVMELLGMAGPIFGLFQNAMFCICLVLMTLVICVVFPYNIGRLASWFIASPFRLIRLIFFFVSVVQDLAALAGGLFAYVVVFPMYFLSKIVGWDKTTTEVVRALQGSWNLSSEAFTRCWGLFWSANGRPTEVQTFTIVSHASLISIKSLIASAFTLVFCLAQAIVAYSWQTLAVLTHPGRWDFAYTWAVVTGGASYGIQLLQNTSLDNISTLLKNPSTWVVDISPRDSFAQLDLSLIHWSTWDRILVILMGYLAITVVSALYLKHRRSYWIQEILGIDIDYVLVEVLTQAGGVMKVLLIISIEMLLFPLYCGILMDAALLPLFEGATLQSRFNFTMQNPLTSVFVHWFVGTGYMFHFALFVAMCRRIMRKGVLYFIRDPDDPEFHPIREVLERNIFVQVRKIMFSALVYGTLVLMCLGGVVWGLSFSNLGLFPIHYSSNEPVLEFPIDLLFYNFLMPLAVKFFKLDDAILNMYTWCFRKAGRMLRLTWYLFGERRIDEEGTLQDVGGKPLPWYKTMTLEVVKTHVVPMNMRFFLTYTPEKPRPTSDTKLATLSERKEVLISTGRLAPDGKFVRVPASDHVRAVKGRNVFIQVEERHMLRTYTPLPGSDIIASQYQLVYLPPRFYLRVFAFIMCLWIFAAVTGVTCTVIPLAVGRYIFNALLPDHVRTNDIYAFTIGVYVLASFGWLTLRLKHATRHANNLMDMVKRTVLDPSFPAWAFGMAVEGAKLLYTYTILVLIFPILLAILVELYVLIPLHTYFYPTSDSKNRHVIPIIQSWTLGILYLKLGARIISRRYPNCRLSQAIRAVTHRGFFNPPVRLFTRAFVLPGLVLSLIAIVAPPALMDFTMSTNVLAPMSDDASSRAFMYRMSYPITAMWVSALIGLNIFFGIVNNWTAKIRDEAYLVGTRLHNLDGVKTPTRGQTRPTMM
ncbi:hypothetical protein BROUX41_002427 [Berkeleyomyces rouxiae]|uniref:uncharacterized protein n=1 Tax=Berkeleyomyces rouxiae TaxID=2035830 RepID=UPI003B797F42